MTPDDELQVMYSAEYEDFLRRERLWEQFEAQAYRAEWRSFWKAFLTAAVTGGIFLMLLVWRFFL